MRPSDVCAVTELAVHVVTPALHVARRRHRTGMHRPRSDGSDARGQSVHLSRLGTRCNRAVPQLLRGVRAPAVQGTGVENRAGMHRPRTDADGWRRQPDHGRGNESWRRGSVSNLSRSVVAPTLHRTVGHQGAGMTGLSGTYVVLAHADGDHAGGECRNRCR